MLVLKGILNRKIADSWFYGTPIITTIIGSEGLYLENYYKYNFENSDYLREKIFKSNSID